MGTEWLADDAYVVFKKLRSFLDKPGDLNEATVRLRVIDALLFDVLKWDKAAVEAEKYARATGFADYVFGAQQKYSLVLEAKREGVPFLIAGRTYPAEPVPFALIAKEYPDAADALRQAQGYANQFGARYSAISNGNQWLLSLTFVPNHSVDDRLVFVFESIDAIGRKFREFYECFSPKAVSTNVPSLKLLEARRAPAPAKLSSQITGYPVPADRNVLINTLRGVLQLVWDEVNSDSDNELFLQHCYIKPEPSEDLLRVAKELLEQRSSRDDISRSVEEADVKKMLTVRGPADKERPVVVLGRIGHGKSTFLKYLRHIEAKQLLQNKYIQLDVDFIDRPATAEEVPSYILDQIEKQLTDVYQIPVHEDRVVRLTLRKELREFHSSPRGTLLSEAGHEQELRLAEVEFMETYTRDRNKYFARLFRHIRHGDGKSVAIFFDNLDRRPDALQEQAFLRASAMAAEWSALVFVCLRPGTVQRSQARGVLDTVAPRIIAVSPPKTTTVLRKRFQYAEKFATRALPADVYERAAFSPEVEASFPQAADFFLMCDQSIHRNPILARQYEAVANGNIRFVMKYVRQVLTSNHLDTHKMIEILASTGSYLLAEHETLRALMFGPSIHYEPNSSPFVNLFDVRRADPQEHFARFLLLEFMNRHANSVDQYGFLHTSTIYAYMGSIGYSLDHARDVVEVLFAKKCIEGYQEPRDDDEYQEIGEEVRITSLGSYHVTSLVCRFVYLDAVVVDTPILDESARMAIRDCMAIEDRLERARDFLRYLDKCADSLIDVEARRVWNDLSVELANDITDVDQEAARNRARRNV